MFNTIVNDYSTKMVHEIVTSKDKTISKSVKKMQELLDENGIQQAMNIAFLPMITSKFLQFNSIEPLKEEHYVEIMGEELKDFVDTLPMATRLLKCEVKLRGLEKQCTRTIIVPYAIPVSMLAYAVLASFGASGYHQFVIEHKKNRLFSTGLCDEEPYLLDEIVLPQMELKKGSKLTVAYDMGDYYEMKVTVKDILSCKHIATIEDMKIESGMGCNIWEDNHYLMELYYEGEQAFNSQLQMDGIDIDEIQPLIDDATFDLEVADENFISNIQLLQMSYEMDCE